MIIEIRIPSPGESISEVEITNWLVNDGDFVEKNQESISELAPKINWRQNFMAIGYSNPVTEGDNEKIDFWLDKPIYYSKRFFYKLIVILLPAITLTFLALLMADVSHYSWFALCALTQLFFASSMLRQTNKEQRLVSEELRILKNYSKLINLIERSD